MKAQKVFYMSLPILGIAIDAVLGYPGLSWLFVSLPQILPGFLMVLLASLVIVMLELLFGASNNTLIMRIGFLVVLFMPALVIAEGYNKYTESLLLEMPSSDVKRIIILQLAQVILVFTVHFLILKKARIILALYSGDNVDEHFEIPYLPDPEEDEEEIEEEDNDDDFDNPGGTPGFAGDVSLN